jgi:hypothetical protein
VATAVPLLTLGVAAALLACQPARPAKADMKPTDVELTWSATPANGSLTVTYHVKNHGADDLYVADGLMSGGQKVDRLVVMNGPADTIRLVRGLVMPDAERLTGIPTPTVTKLPAGQTLDATVVLPLPLVAWHNAGKVTPLRPATTLTLEVATFTTPDGTPTWLRGEPLPAP